jgi:hypothetical protein
MASIRLDGSIELLTKSFVLRQETEEDRAFPKKNGKYIEFSVALTYHKEPKEQPVPQKEVVPHLILRLVHDMVERNEGMIKFELDETKAKRFISLKLPVERRNVFPYE